MKNTERNSLFSRSLLSIMVMGAFLFGPSQTLAQTATTESGVQNVPTGFSDVTRAHPYYVGIMYLTQQGILQGYEDKTFKAEAPINKAEVTKVIVEGLKAPQDATFEPVFSDLTEDLWYSPYVMKARQLGFVSGNEVDKTFAGSKQVNMAEFLKMLLIANKIDVSAFEGKTIAPGIPAEEWFAKYVNYAVALGITPTKADGSLDPSKPLTRGEVANMMYLLSIIMKGSDTQFLLTRAEAELAQIEVYIAANQVALAKNASELAVDFTQQALKNMPDEKVVLGAAKIARSYDWLVDAYIFGIQNKKPEAAQKANEAIDKATEAWQANPDTQSIASHIKERAREILTQVGGTEN